MSREAKSTLGFTLVEVICALLIVLLSVLAFFHLFTYGTMQLEKQGRRRQALAVLQGEMEFWRARFAVAGEAGVAPSEALARARKLDLGESAPKPAELRSALTPRQRRGDLSFQLAQVAVIWGHPGEEDTLRLESAFYAP